MSVAIRIQQDHGETLEALTLEAEARAARIFNTMTDKVKQGNFGPMSTVRVVEVKTISPKANHERLVAKRKLERCIGTRL